MSTNPEFRNQVQPLEAMRPAQQLEHLAVAHPNLAELAVPADGLHRLDHDADPDGTRLGHEHASLEQHMDRLVQPPETTWDRHWRQYDHALARATALAELSDHAWEGADRHGMVVTYGDSGVPCHEVARMFAQQSQAWALIAAARHASMQAGS
jgi:hypothetical protein